MTSESKNISGNKPDGGNITRSTWIVSAITMFSRILGLARDWCLMAVFGGTAWITDAFVLAFTIPNLFRRLFGEGALSAAFVPVFVHTRENESKEEASKLGSVALTLLATFTGLLAMVGIVLCLGADAFLPTDATGWFDKEALEKLHLTLKLAAVMLPFMCFICCSALMSGMLQSLRIFWLPAGMSIILNLCFLASFGYIYYFQQEASAEKNIFLVAIAVVSAGLIQIILQWPALIAKGVSIFPRFDLKHEGVSEVLKAMGPTALGLGVVQLNVLIDNFIAYYLSLSGAEGANTYLYLGNRLMQLPLGVFGVAVATTVFPYLSSNASRNEHEEFLERIKKAVRMLLFVMLPASIGLGVISVPLVRLIFQGQDLSFSDLAVYRTSLVLILYAAGLMFFSLQHLLTRVFYARKDYLTPVKIAACMVLVNLTLNIALIHAPDMYRHWAGDHFYESWQISKADFNRGENIEAVPGEIFKVNEKLGEAGLALATSITAIINVLLLWFVLKGKMAPAIGEEKWEKIVGELQISTLKITCVSVVMGVLVYFCINSIPYEPEFIARLQRCAFPVILGIISYWIFCAVTPIAEWEEFMSRKSKSKPRKKE